MTKNIYLLLFSLVLFSCNGDKNSKLHLPSVNGKSGEILLILEEDYWNDSIGKHFKDILMSETPALPQDEPLFDISQIPNEGFTKVMQASRNIIRVNIQEGLKPAINFRKDVWAAPQAIIKMQAGNEADFLVLLDTYSTKIVDFLLEAERHRNLLRAQQYEAIEIERKLKSKYNIDMIIPEDFQLYSERKDFVWLSKETRNYQMGIVVYYYNYTDTATFTKEYLINKRDSVLKVNIPGANKGSYMTTERRVEPLLTHLKFKGQYFAEVRGIWDMVNDAMGGPFVSYTMLDKKNNRIITAEGFVYYPNNNKRELVRQLEAILLTLKVK